MTVAGPDEMRQYDALYEPFPPFADWPRLPEHLVAQWDELVERLDALRVEATEDDFAAVREEAMRAAAWDTGAIEGLYTTDRGFTITVAAQAADWEAQVRREKGADALAMFAAQLEAYRQALDAATEATPISEAWIRHLHEVATAAQDDYEVSFAAGKQVHDLPKGEYKYYPNHILQADGRVFAHAPVADVPAEMGRMVGELRSGAFADGHPIEQASYAHYALVRIHPFADGNGRVARALASVFTFRAVSMPLVVYSDERNRYLGALESADSGERTVFARFLLRSVAESAREVSTHLRRRLTGTPNGKLGSDDPEVADPLLDVAAYALLDEAEAALRDAFEARGIGSDIAQVGLAGRDPLAVPKERRLATSHGFRMLVANVRRAEEGRSVSVGFVVLIATARNSLDRFELVTAELDNVSEEFSTDGLVPRVSQRSRRRLETWADNAAAQMLALAGVAAASPTAGPGESGG